MGFDSKKFDDLMSQLEAIDKPEKQAVFGLGVLTKFVGNIQYGKLEKSPIYSKFFGLEIGQHEVQRILKMVVRKLIDYDRLHAYQSLQNRIAENLGTIKKWELSKDETTYFFVLGMMLAEECKDEND
ncbi:MAG: hypothetical protein GF308_17725 [Candidatus Heimdallarchaeota archaeon]|nr:hypothetical protein [Candidatus Heimdallarchaeota archaeon]